MRVAFVNPYHAGSHRAFCEGWVSRSRHDYALVTFPGRHWKWRMRHAGISAARALAALETRPDAIVTTDMCNAAELRGHLPRTLRDAPMVVYFHENQLAYPTRTEPDGRDDHFALTNLSSVLAADEAWFNSRYNVDTMIEGLRALLRRMPTPRLLDTLDDVRSRSRVLPPGVDDTLFDIERDEHGRAPGAGGAPLRILWNARWEHDKGVDVLVDALDRLHESGVRFTCDLVGPSNDGERSAVESLRDRLGSRVGRLGAQPADAYRAALGEADVVVSAARHEFFGIAVLEGVGAGARPVVPASLAYPEVLADVKDVCWWSGGADDLARALGACAARLEKTGKVWATGPGESRASVREFAWSVRANRFDNALDALVDRLGSPSDNATLP